MNNEKKNALVVGMKLYDYALNEYTISSIGKKYFSVKERTRSKYFIDNLKLASDYGATQLYADKQFVLDMKEQNDLYSKIQTRFMGYIGTFKPTLEQLRNIDKILNVNNANDLQKVQTTPIG